MTERQLNDAYERFGHLVFRRCLAILRDEAAAKDAVQEVFVRLWRLPDGFTAAHSKLRWLYRVGERICFDVLDRHAHQREEPLQPEHDDVHSAPPAANAIDDGEVVLRFISRFDERTRQVALLFYLDGLTREQIAAETGWSRHTVAKKLALLQQRATALRRLLTGEETRCA
ncbi:MAG: sigma-70 family RNA polymerase sigma factor [Archangiaceae bacterium]|nr:sigma-70 family RNA polymerase sigma factor [Archangiaceae bacterium]